MAQPLEQGLNAAVGHRGVLANIQTGSPEPEALDLATHRPDQSTCLQPATACRQRRFDFLQLRG